MSHDKRKLSILSEGVNDPGIFKAVFLSGGPGSGKSTVVRKMVLPGRYGLKSVNVDTLFELFLKKSDSSMDMTGGSSKERSERMKAFNRARSLTKKQQENFIDGRLGLVIDGTGGSFGVINKQKKQLEDLGYDTFMVFVDTTLDTAIDRNTKRGEKGGRRLQDKDLMRSWNAVNKNKEAYMNLFGDNIVIVDGNKFDQKEIAQQSNNIRRFIESQPSDPEAKSWIANELQMKGSTMSESQIRNYVRSLLMEVPLDDFEYLAQSDDDVMVREEVADYFKAIPQSVNIYVAHTDDLSWAHRLPNEIQGKVSGFKSRGQVTLTDISNIGKLYPQIQRAMNPEGINLLYVYPKSFEVPAGGDTFVADVNAHYLAHDLHHMLEGVPGGIGNKGKEQFSALIKEYLMELVWLSHGGGTMEAEHVRDSMKKTGRRLGVSNPDVLLSELFPGVNLPSGEFDLFGDIFADYLKNDGSLVLGVPEQLNMKNGDIIELNPGAQHDNRAQQYEEKFKNMFDTVLDPLKGKVAMFNIFEVEHRGLERARKKAEEKMQVDHGPLIDLVKAMGGEFKYFDESYKEEGTEELIFDTGLKPEKAVMGVEEFAQQFPKEVEGIEALGYKITSAFDGFGQSPVEIRLQKRENMKEEVVVRSYVAELIREETSAYNVVLDLVGLVPGLGEFADAANVIDYARKGDYLFAGLSLISLVPVIGDAVGKGGKLAVWFTKAFPKGAKMAGKHGPKVIKQIKQAKTVIRNNRDKIDKVFEEVENNEKFEKIKPHLPKIKEALDAFLGSEVPDENVTEGLVRQYIRTLLIEDPMGFVHDLAASDSFGDQFFGGQIGKEAGRDIKRAFNKNADHQFLSTLDTVHWVNDFYAMEDLKGRGKDELSTTMTLPGDSLEPAAGLPYGLWIKGRITLATNDQDKMYSGFYGDYGVGHEGDEEAVTQRDRSSGRNKRPSVSKDYSRYGQLKRGDEYMEKMARDGIPYVLDQSTWNPADADWSNNEALVDNWRPRGIIVVKDDVVDAVLKTAEKLISGGQSPASGNTAKDIDYFSAGVVKKIMLASLDLSVPIYDTDRKVLWSPK